MIKTCIICGKDYQCERDSAKYCSNACKQKKMRVEKRAMDTAKSRTPTMGEFQDLNLVRTISPETYTLMTNFWGKYGKTIGGEVLAIVWSMMVDANLIPKDYKDSGL